MKIKNVSCTQFAGIRDRSISFDEGINLIYGKNESGKSTLVNLISCIFFKMFVLMAGKTGNLRNCIILVFARKVRSWVIMRMGKSLSVSKIKLMS
ncbi:MAG: AAA family ATPase [Lachnospiraceae bacterium]|nr:AAA family ATPase [Lachnospiraceae bacterium]